MAHQGRKAADDRLLMALACGGIVEAAAKQSGVGESTVYARLRNPEFKKKLQSLRADIVQRTAGALTAASVESVRTLLELQKPPTPPATRLGAARAVLEIGLKIREVVELEVRLSELEERVATQEGNRPRD